MEFTQSNRNFRLHVKFTSQQRVWRFFFKIWFSSSRLRKHKTFSILQNDRSFQYTQVIENLEGFKLELQVTRKTTHLITASPQRTINVLRGIIRGVWILSFDWIIESANSGKWLYEEPFEVRNFSRAISVQSFLAI